MLERIQAFANADGTISPDRIEIFDAPITTHPITGEQTRGDLIRAELSAAARQRIADAINAELGGAAKFAERMAGARKAHADKIAKEKAEAKARADEQADNAKSKGV